MKNIQVVRVNVVKEKGFRYGTNEIKSPEIASDICYKYLNEYCNNDRENFFILCLSTKNTVNAINLISSGTLNASLVHPREVFKSAILANSASVILCHNHPSGNTMPSREDINLSKRLAEAGDLLGIEVLDHVIIGNNEEDSHTSLKVKGLF